MNQFAVYNHIEMVEVEPDHAIFRLNIRPESKNGYGMVHGGAIYAMADNATGFAAHTDGRSYVTQTSALHFLRNQSEGEIRADAQVRHRGHSTCLVAVDILGENNKLIATGEFTFFCVDPELMASKIFERVWGDQREIVLQTCKMLDACYKPDADRRADLMKAKDDSIQLLQQQLDDLVVVRARGEIEQDKFLQRTIEIQQQMEALRQSKAQIASEDYNPGRLDMEAIEAALCEAVEMHDGLVSEDFIDLFVSQVTPLSDSRFAWCLDFSPQPTVAFLNLAGQRKYTTCSMDSKLHFGPFADEEGHTIPFPGSLRR